VEKKLGDHQSVNLRQKEKRGKEKKYEKEIIEFGDQNRGVT